MEVKRIFFNPDKPAELQPEQTTIPVEQPSEDATLEDKVIAAIRTVYDPEIPVNLYDLGLIYNLDIDNDNNIKVQMTLTAPACPVAEILPQQVEAAISTVPEVSDISIEMVWDPPWNKELISDDAKLTLGIL
jgi:FeS assembly SUF system protein